MDGSKASDGAMVGGMAWGGVEECRGGGVGGDGETLFATVGFARHILFFRYSSRDFIQRPARPSRWATDLRRLLSQRSTAIAAAKFMMATKLLGQFGATSRSQHEA